MAGQLTASYFSVDVAFMVCPSFFHVFCPANIVLLAMAANQAVYYILGFASDMLVNGKLPPGEGWRCESISKTGFPAQEAVVP